MTFAQPGTPESLACQPCERRAWLLSLLSAQLDYCALRQGRLNEVLALGDVELMSAMGGRRRAALSAAYERFEPGAHSCADGHQPVCRHDRCFPRGLLHPAGPYLLYVDGAVERMADLNDAAVVGMLGATRASDYGLELARSIARGLSAAGVTVAVVFTDGIARAALAGALEAGGRALAVLRGGMDVARPAARRSLYERLLGSGLAVAELPCACSGRRWGELAAERVVAAAGEVTVLVESRSEPDAINGVATARALGRTVAAVPGPVTSSLSTGPHALLMAGAPLVRSAEDVLELLAVAGTPAPLLATPVQEPAVGLEPRLVAVLERVGAGVDTPDKLAATGADPGATLLALSELELMGLLARGDGGRYLPTKVPSSVVYPKSSLSS